MHRKIRRGQIDKVRKGGALASTTRRVVCAQQLASTEASVLSSVSVTEVRLLGRQAQMTTRLGKVGSLIENSRRKLRKLIRKIGSIEFKTPKITKLRSVYFAGRGAGGGRGQK